MLPYSLRQTAVPLRLQSFLSYISFAEIYLFFCFLRSCLKTIYISNKCNSDQITFHNFLSFPYPPVYQIPALCTQKHVLCRKKAKTAQKEKIPGTVILDITPGNSFRYISFGSKTGIKISCYFRNYIT